MLTTIADLDRLPPDQLTQLLNQARCLGPWWDKWKLQDTGDHDLHIQLRQPKHRPPGLHASEVSGCPRKMGYSIVGTPKKHLRQLKMQRIFDLGHMVHAHTQYELHRMCDWLGTDRIRYEDEVAVNPGLGGVAAYYDIYSSSDGVFTFLYNGVPYLRVLLEIKTEGPDDFKTRGEVKEAHKKQMHVYMKALDVPVGWALYINKSNMKCTPSSNKFLFTYNNEVWNEVERHVITSKAELLQRGILQKEEGFECSWCPYSWTCDPDYNKQRKKLERNMR